jgi:N-acetyl-alpha-D-glucosaminyl L-malate synthase BshA
MLAPVRPDIKVLTTLHGTDITIVGQDPSFHAITKFSIEKSDGLTAVSHYLRNETQAVFGCAGERIEVIPNFIDPTVYDRSRYAPELRNSVEPGRKILIHVSNFRPVKRVRDVVRIYAQVAKRIPSVLVMVGDGPDRVDAEEEARQLGVADSVFFLGKLESVAPLLASADLFLLPTSSESFGLSALEALAMGVPVIGTRAGGLPEVVRHGETGALCAVGDVDAMARASIELLADPARWQAASTLAIADARTRFSLNEVVEQYESFYSRALAGALR